MSMFIGVLLSQTASEALTDALVRAREQLPGIRWVDRELWHVTLYYIGDLDDSKRDAVTKAVAEIAEQQKYLNLYFDRLMVFPQSNGQQHLVVLLRKSQALAQLAHLLRSTLDPILGKSEKQVFRPHVTIAKNVTRDLSVLPPFETEKRFEIVHLELIQSDDSSGRKTYLPMMEWNLLSDKWKDDEDR